MKITETRLRKIIREAILQEGRTIWTPAGRGERMAEEFRNNYSRTIHRHYQDKPDMSGPFQGYDVPRPRIPLKPEALEMIEHAKKAKDMARSSYRAAREYLEANGIDPNSPGLTGAESVYEENYGKPLTFHQELEIVIDALHRGDIK